MFATGLFIRPSATSLLLGLLLATPGAAPDFHFPAGVPAATATAGEYGGAIEQVWSEFDVWQNGFKGMIVHVKFHTNGLRGVPCRATAYFAYEGGRPLTDYDGSYNTGGGNVAAGANFTPIYEDANFSDLRIFIPYTQLHMAIGRHYLQYSVELYTVDYNDHFARSRPVTFVYTEG